MAFPCLFVEIVGEVVSKYYSGVVEFESLCGVYAAYLIYSAGIVGPKVRFGSSVGKYSSFGLGIPGSTIVANDYVVFKSSIGFWIRPRPTETRRNSSSISSLDFGTNRVLD